MSMIKGFPIDYVRQVIEQTMLEEKIKEPKKYFGGDREVRLFSFYEQMATEEEVNRYVEDMRALTDQQNRTDLMMNGIVTADETPSVVNLNKGFIIPLNFQCAFRVPLKDRDMAVDTINHLISVLKGRKQDIAGFSYKGDSNTKAYVGKPFKVQTIANDYGGSPNLELSEGSYYGDYSSGTIATFMSNTLTALASVGIDVSDNDWGYVRNSSGEMKVVALVNNAWSILENDGSNKDIIFPPKGTFEKYKISMSFDSVKIDEPRNLNSNQYVDISFGGSATICNHTQMLGNDLVKVGIKRKKIEAKNGDITITENTHWLEPLEMPSGNGADTISNQVASSLFKTKTHTDSITLSLQYTFVLDIDDKLIENWFDYARYGVQADGSVITYANGITPNMIYEINEVWSSWGKVSKKTFTAKIVESIDIENTESDTLSIKIPFQIQ